MEYRLRVLAMTSDQIAAEQARVKAAQPGPDADPVLVRRLPAFLTYAKAIADGAATYHNAVDDLVPASIAQ